MRSFFYTCRPWGLASISLLQSSTLTAKDPSASYLEDHLTDKILNLDNFNYYQRELIDKCNEMENSILSKKGSLLKIRESLIFFIQELNTRYGLRLTIEDALILIEENLNKLSIDQESCEIISETIKLIKPTKDKLESQNFNTINSESLNLRIELPWLESLSKKNKTKKSKKDQKKSSIPLYLSASVLQDDNELPGSIYIGSAEILAGALSCVLGMAFPPAYALGIGLIGDGTKRIFDGLEMIDQEKKETIFEKNP